MKKNRLKNHSLSFILACTIILISGVISGYQQPEHKQKKKFISPQQLINNLEGKAFTGKKITVKAINRDIVTVIKEIFIVSGLPVKIESDIRGKITLLGLDTPWDQILSRVLKKANLQITFDGVILWIKRDGEKRKKKEGKFSTKILEKTSTKYIGEKGDFIFKDADLKNVILFFAKNYKLNIVMDPGISGKVTCCLIQVPWDQALDVILRRHGLAIIQAGSVFNIKKY